MEAVSELESLFHIHHLIILIMFCLGSYPIKLMYFSITIFFTLVAVLKIEKEVSIWKEKKISKI